MICEIKNTAGIEKLFENWEETLIWSALQGVMGKIYVTEADKNKEEPAAAMVLLGDFCFLAGQANKELVRCKPEGRAQNFVIMVPQDNDWARAIEEVYGERAKKVTRYAIKKEKDIFDREHLRRLAGRVPEGYQLKMIDEALFLQCRQNKWAEDLVSQYGSYEEYKRLGLGAAVLKDGVIAAGASSYSSYNGGIEIEIDTQESHRRKGLATACGAKLILECLDRGLYPSWDAQNLWSVALAKKLGYHFSHEYVAYEIWGY
ncbi:MAG: GNAT family N-acetyltransferase [Clostridium sp.]|nr:GNAT family N-acetyltransferase [Clostridium sp.]